MNIYRQIILEQYKDPLHWGELSGDALRSKQENPSCGDSIEMSITVREGILKDAKFTGDGCAISIAATALLLDQAIGEEIREIQAFSKKDIEILLGGPLAPARIKCGTLGLELLQNLLNTKNYPV